MRRAIIVSGDFVATGGMDMPNFALARHLADRGVFVDVVAYRVADELSSHPKVRWHQVPKPLDSYMLAAPLLDRVGRRVSRESTAADSRTIVNGGNCRVGDVNWVHYVHAAYEPATVGSIASRSKGRLAHRLNLHLERAALRVARVIIANSQRTRHDLITLLDIDESRIRTVYYGIDSTRFFPPGETRRHELRERFGWPNRPQLAFVGALGDRRKGFDTVYAAWSLLCKSTAWDADLVVVGRGAELKAWRERAKADGIGDRIRFLGFRSDVPDILAACDALVAPTRYEAFGLGVQEALATGLPALVSAAAGVSERYPLELQALLLSDPNSANELKAGLVRWREQASELSQITMRLSETLRQRTWETMAGEIGGLVD